jgi:tellurite resistance protein TerC
LSSGRLRSLYVLVFLVAGLVSRFVYRKPSLAAVLMFVGAKMLIVDIVKIPPTASLAVVCGMERS